MMKSVSRLFATLFLLCFTASLLFIEHNCNFVEAVPTVFACSPASSTTILLVSGGVYYSEGIVIELASGCQSVRIDKISTYSITFDLTAQEKQQTSLGYFSPSIPITISSCLFSFTSSSSSSSNIKVADINFATNNSNNNNSNFWQSRKIIQSISISNSNSTWNLPADFFASSIAFIDFPLVPQQQNLFELLTLSVTGCSFEVTSSSSSESSRVSEVSFISITRVPAFQSSSASLPSLSISNSLTFTNNKMTLSDALAHKSASNISFLLVKNGTSFLSGSSSSSSISFSGSSISSFERKTASAQLVRVQRGAEWIQQSSQVVSTFDHVAISLLPPSNVTAAVTTQMSFPSLVPPLPFVALFSILGSAPKQGTITASDVWVSVSRVEEDGTNFFLLMVDGSTSTSSSSSPFDANSTLSFSFIRINATSSSSLTANNFISVFGFAANINMIINPGFNTTFTFINCSWSCDPVQKQARQALPDHINKNTKQQQQSQSGGGGKIIFDQCSSTLDQDHSGDYPDSFGSDFSKAASAFFSTAIVSAASMSAVAFGLSRSQEVGEFVGNVATGSCVADNASVVPDFSDNPLGLRLPDEFCGYNGGSVAGNLLLVAGVSLVSLWFGTFGTCVKKKGFGTIYRVLNTGYFGIVVSNAIGLFVTPIIQHASLCAIRPGGHMAIRIFAGIISSSLFVFVPLWVYFALIRSKICDRGILVKEKQKPPSCCRRAISTTWNWVFGTKVWKFAKGKSNLINHIEDVVIDDVVGKNTKKKSKNSPERTSGKNAFMSPVESEEDESVQQLLIHPAETKSVPTPTRKKDTSGKNNSNNNTDNDATATPLIQVTKRPDENIVASAQEEIVLEQKFKTLRPLFEDYDKRFPTFFFVEVLTNTLLGTPSLIAEIFAFHTTDLVGGDRDPKPGCYSWGGIIAAVLLVYWLLLLFLRPIQRRIVLIANFLVSGFQLTLVVIAIYSVTLGPEHAPSWSGKIDVALVITQAALSLVGVVLALKEACSGGLTKLKNCLCPQRNENNNRNGGGAADGNDSDDDDDDGDDEEENENMDENDEVVHAVKQHESGLYRDEGLLQEMAAKASNTKNSENKTGITKSKTEEAMIDLTRVNNINNNNNNDDDDDVPPPATTKQNEIILQDGDDDDMLL